jgi:hypothetical protein
VQRIERGLFLGEIARHQIGLGNWRVKSSHSAKPMRGEAKISLTSLYF